MNAAGNRRENMTREYAETELAAAMVERDAARAAWNLVADKPWSKRKRDAGERLVFWISKVTNLDAGVKGKIWEQTV